MNTTQTLQSLLNEQQRRWTAGDRPAVEQLLDLSSSAKLTADERLDLIYGEILLREQTGEQIDPAGYLERFPDLAEQLRLQFEVHSGLSGLSTVGREDTRPCNEGLESDPVTELPPGYELVGVLGRGGAGTVYRAMDRQLGREVAIKFLTADDPDSQLRLRREAELLARVQHPGVVQVFAVGDHNGKTWMAQEYVLGDSLRKRLSGKPVPPKLAATFMAHAAQGVAQIQAAGIVHCDLTPGNILVSDPPGGECGDERWLLESKPKVSDFGLARWLHIDRSETGNIEGTLLYLSPEQALGSRSRISPATDVYGLGAILFEMLTGRPPFLGPSAAELLEQILRQEPVSPRQLRLQLDRDLETICLKCLDKEPARRYVNAAALAEDLERYCQQRPILARPIGWSGRIKRWAMRNRALASSLAAIFLVLVAGIAASSTAARIALANAAIAQSAKAMAEKERNRANDERDLARIERDRADAKAAESARLAFSIYRMLSQAQPELRDGPYLLADWIEDSLEDDSFFENMSSEYEGGLRLKLAETLQQLDRQQESVPHFRRAIELLDQGGLHDDAGQARRQLAIILSSKTAGWVDYPERFAEAEKLLQETIESENVSPKIRRAATNRLAQCLFLAGKPDQAEQVIRELLAEFESLVPPDEYGEAEARKFLCHIFSRTGRAENAVPVLREIIAHPPQEMLAASIEEAGFQLAECLDGSGLENHPEAIDLYEKALREFLARYRQPTHAAVIRVASALALCLVRHGGQPGRLLNDLEPHYSDLRIDENTGLSAAQIVASLHVCRAQVGEVAESYQRALSAIRRILKLHPMDDYALYVQLLLAKEMSKQGLSEQALPIVLEVQTLVSAPDAPEEVHYMRLGSLQTLYGVYMILGNGTEADSIRAQIPEAVPELPEDLIHPSLRKVNSDQQRLETLKPAGPAK